MKQTAEVLHDKPLPSIGGFLYLVLEFSGHRHLVSNDVNRWRVHRSSHILHLKPILVSGC